MEQIDNKVIEKMEKQLQEIAKLKQDNQYLSFIVKMHKYCVTPRHCQNQSEIRKETVKDILQILEFLKRSVLQNYGVAETVGLDVAIRKIKEKFGDEVEDDNTTTN